MIYKIKTLLRHHKQTRGAIMGMGGKSMGKIAFVIKNWNNKTLL